MLKSKIHRAVVTDADLNYEGSISIDPKLCEAADLVEFEKVDVYNCDNGNRFHTYVIWGKPGEICINGAAAHLAQPDKSECCRAHRALPHYHPWIIPQARPQDRARKEAPERGPNKIGDPRRGGLGG